MDDLISRQEAIDALNACCVKYDISPNYDDKRTDKEKFYDWWDMHKVLSMRIINDLPSAEKVQLSGEDATFDCISRQDAVKTIYDLCERIDRESLHIDVIVDTLENLPSTEPRKKGKWIEQDAGGDGVFYECSVCKDAFTLMDGTPSDNNYNFCPNCGSYNGGEEE